MMSSVRWSDEFTRQCNLIDWGVQTPVDEYRATIACYT